MGSIDGPSSFMMRYKIEGNEITLTNNKNEELHCEQSKLFPWMQRKLDSYGLKNIKTDKINIVNNQGETLKFNEVPFDFLCGFVGYIGYEIKRECFDENIERGNNQANVPDSAFLFVDRLIVFDHQEKHMWLVELVEDGKASAWANEMTTSLDHLASSNFIGNNGASTANNEEKTSATFSMKLRDSKTQYTNNVKTAIENIIEGETYEVCLTTQFKITNNSHETNMSSKSFQVYKHLRERNPAPYGAYFRFNSNFAIASSSPEKFMQIDRNGDIMMKPIKGTISRGFAADGVTFDKEKDKKNRLLLENSEKDKSENLMVFLKFYCLVLK